MHALCTLRILFNKICLLPIKKKKKKLKDTHISEKREEVQEDKNCIWEKQKAGETINAR